MMGILGIENRTENWKTARYFTPFFTTASARGNLANKLLEPLSKSQSSNVEIELFWKGIRDHWEINQKKTKETKKDRNVDFMKHYNRIFGDLCDSMKTSNLRSDMKENWNYSVSPRDQNAMKKPGNNLINTEIDIILKTPKHLFIGETKHLEDFSKDTDNVLVHQLIREYVTAKILLGRLDTDLKVVPFVIRDKFRAEGNRQVKFMLNQRGPDGQPWLKEENILSWNDIEVLHP
ncbi:MAG: hypothetical protein J4F46_03980 [Dehalococcoidia bacterium]|nr:hypothetical protein [Dehalococcoidia bacterium]